MTRERGRVFPLETKRIRAGQYLIEGWDVTRRGSGSHTRWAAERRGEFFTRRTLDEIKETIMTDASDITRAYLADLDSPALAGMLRDYAGQIEQPHSTLAALLTEAADRLDSAAATEPGLREHCAEFHPRITLRGQSDDRVSAEHGRQHFQHGSATHHHGPNPGPHARPRGWRDGSGVVLVNLRNAMRRRPDPTAT